MSEDTDTETQHKLITASVRLLQGAGQAWTSISGREYWLFDEDVYDQPLARYHEERGNGGMLWEEEEDVRDEDDDWDSSLGVLESEYQFWATASPWRLRLERLRQVSSVKGEDPIPSLLIVNGDRWRSTYRNQVKTGTMTPDKSGGAFGEYATPGQENLDLLLRPASFARAFTFSAAREVIVQGRRAIRMRATPVPTDDFIRGVPGIIVCGTDDYVVAVDALSGIVLEVEIFIDGQLVRRHALSDLVVDGPMDPSLFELELPRFGGSSA